MTYEETLKAFKRQKFAELLDAPQATSIELFKFINEFRAMLKANGVTDPVLPSSCSELESLLRCCGFTDIDGDCVYNKRKGKADD